MPSSSMPSARAVRRGAAVAVVAAVVSAGLMWVPGAEAAPPSSEAPSGPSSAAEALRKAAERGKPVEVPSLTTETQQVTADPEGTFTMTRSVMPVRVRRAGRWVGIDTTLRRSEDGGVRPVATAASLRLSGGGSGPLAEMTNSGHRMTVSWPEPLPAPTLTGDTAIYSRVVPDVDLHVTVTPAGGFSQVLVVKTPQAAASPKLATLRLATRAAGLTVTRDEAGSLTAADTTGTVVFSAPPPIMWDSSALPDDAARRQAAADSSVDSPADSAGDEEPAPPRSDTTGPGWGAKQTPVPATVDPSGVTLRPDRGMLTDPGTRYPVFIDPAWHPEVRTQYRQAYVMVHQGHPTTSFYNTTSNGKHPGVGYQGWEPVKGIERTFFQINTRGLWNKNIIAASLNLTETYSASWGCEKYPVEVWQHAAISNKTTWRNQPDRGPRIGVVNVPGANNKGCPGNQPVEVTVTSAMKTAAERRWSHWTFGLYAGNEGDKDAFKRFATNPSITVQYNTPPVIAAGSNKTTPATRCATQAPHDAVGNTDVDLKATPVDPDGTSRDPVPVDAQFQVWYYKGTELTKLFPDQTRPGTSGKPRVLNIDSRYFQDNVTYSWNVRAYDGRDHSAWTTTCRFTVDQSKPGKPAVTSADYPAETTGLPARTPGTFRFSPAPAAQADDRPTCYLYALNVAPPDTATCANPPRLPGSGKVTAASDGTAQISITPTRVGANTLQVRAFDRAGNPSADNDYDFTTDKPPTPDPAGDFTGDGTPDLLGVGKPAHPGLWLHAVTKNGDVPPGTQVGGAGTTNEPGAKPADWIGAITAHADVNGDGAQDLLAQTADKKLGIYLGAGDGSTFVLTDDRLQLICLPTTDGSEGCAHVDQFVTAGDADGDGQAHDLIAVIGDQLWLYPASILWRTYEVPVLQGASGWADETIAAATVRGIPALWARHKTTGELALHIAGENAPPGSDASTKINVAATGWAASAKPLIVGSDVNTDGNPDLWAVTPARNGNLWINFGTRQHGLEAPSEKGYAWLNWFSTAS